MRSKRARYSAAAIELAILLPVAASRIDSARDGGSHRLIS
jgi:hypothetical protein